jgi:hypothetical protein
MQDDNHAPQRLWELIRIQPQHAEYWDTKSRKLVQHFSYAKAVASAKAPRAMGEHRDVPPGRRS